MHVLAQRLDRFTRPLLDEQALRRPPHPTIVAVETTREFLPRARRELDRRLLALAADHAPYAAAVERLFERALLDLLAQPRGDEQAVLQHAAVHVDDVQRAVGTFVQEHRP